MNPARLDMILRLRSAGISDNAVLRAMETLPRAAFIDGQYADIAYQDRAIPIECGQSLSAPLVLAAMAQAAQLTGEGKILEIGTGTGYGAAVLSKLCKRVYSVERYKTLIRTAEARLGAHGVSNVVLRHGDGRYGWRGQAPFDVIIVTAGLRIRPVGLIAQLKPGGRLICALGGLLTVIQNGQADRVLFAIDIPPMEPGKSKAL